MTSKVLKKHKLLMIKELVLAANWLLFWVPSFRFHIFGLFGFYYKSGLVSGWVKIVVSIRFSHIKKCYVSFPASVCSVVGIKVGGLHSVCFGFAIKVSGLHSVLGLK